MGERCELVLDKEVYRPGDAVNGRVECHFLVENKVREIRVRFRGRAKVYWKESRKRSYHADEVYFEMEANLLRCETTFTPGSYSYPFTFNLPHLIPSSMEDSYGSVRYSVRATIDKPWAVDYEQKKIFKVFSHLDLHSIEDIRKPMEFKEEKQPFSFFEDGLVTIKVNLPMKGYVPSQMIIFSALVRNNSNVNVEEVRFKLVQGFVFKVDDHVMSTDTLVGQEFAIIDSSVAPKYEKTWDLELRVPAEMFNGNLSYCKLIDAFWELRGEVCLPFPHTNFKIKVPFVLGAVPLADSAVPPSHFRAANN